MNKADLVEVISSKEGLTKAQSERILNLIIDSIKNSLKKGEEVTIAGFGSFKVKTRAARQGVNPKTGEKIQIPEKKVPKFKPGKGLKEAVA